MPGPDGEPDDGAMVRSLFDYLTERLKAICSDCDMGVYPPVTKDGPDTLTMDLKFYYGDPNRTKVLGFRWHGRFDDVVFVTMSSDRSVIDDCISYDVSEVRGMRRDYLWNRVFGLVIRSLGKVVEV